MSDWKIHDCEVKYYKMKIAELEAKNKDLENTVEFFKKQAQELRYQKEDLNWKVESFRKMEDTWLGDKRRAEAYALALEEQENISWAESQIHIGELKEELKNKDGQLDAMRTLNDSMEDMLSQTKKKLEDTKNELYESMEARGGLEDRNDELRDVIIELQDEITELRDEIERLNDAMPIPGAAIYATEASRDFYTGRLLSPKIPKIPAKGEKCSLCHQKMKKVLPGASHVEEKMERFRGQTGYFNI